ncbi:amidase family protein [Amycolatopsis granulosa]|uniref:amidase family protein n=1 Tax=Amycolatopsis granulosa TaxID=185684 RepID=UPI0014218DA3|nr:amidase family protein [Amycolatopsis granulosa]NIH84887.1 amidase [Amycolatopsis granulosa]
MSSPLSGADALRQADRLGLPVGAAELPAVRELVTEILDTIGALPAPEPSPASGRPTRSPTTADDPLNAVTRWTDAGPTGSGPLDGVRVAVKDCIAVSGVPMTAGSALLAGFRPDADSTVVARLRAAGGRIVATTRMDELGLAAGGDSGRGGPVRNPFDPTRTAGGSSSGCAAALHYDTVDVAVGADQGGSVRVPAAWCGVFGLKPTHGLVPATGSLGIDHTLDHLGPMARTTADLARVLDVLAGPDGADPRQRDLSPPAGYARAVADAPPGLAGVRLGVVRECVAGAEPDVRAAFEDVLDELTKLGATVVVVDLPELADAGALCFGTTVEGTAALLAAGGNGYQWRGRYWPELAQGLAQGWRDSAGQLGTAAKAVLLAGAHLQEAYRGEWYARAQNARARLEQGYVRALTGVDALLSPTTPGLPHSVSAPSDAARVRRGWAVLANTAPANVTGLPALSMPLAQSGGLPVAVMLTGRRFDEGGLLAISAVCEREIGVRPRR